MGGVFLPSAAFAQLKSPACLRHCMHVLLQCNISKHRFAALRWERFEMHSDTLVSSMLLLQLLLTASLNRMDKKCVSPTSVHACFLLINAVIKCIHVNNEDKCMTKADCGDICCNLLHWVCLHVLWKRKSVFRLSYWSAHFIKTCSGSSTVFAPLCSTLFRALCKETTSFCLPSLLN